MYQTTLSHPTRPRYESTVIFICVFYLDQCQIFCLMQYIALQSTNKGEKCISVVDR